MPIISGRSKLVCSNNYLTLYRKSKLKQTGWQFIDHCSLVCPPHLKDLKLADPVFGRPGKIDILLGIDVYTDVLLHGRRSGPPGSPIAFETIFGWVLAGRTSLHTSVCLSIATNHVGIIYTVLGKSILTTENDGRIDCLLYTSPSPRD